MRQDRIGEVNTNINIVDCNLHKKILRIFFLLRVLTNKQPHTIIVIISCEARNPKGWTRGITICLKMGLEISRLDLASTVRCRKSLNCRYIVWRCCEKSSKSNSIWILDSESAWDRSLLKVPYFECYKLVCFLQEKRRARLKNEMWTMRKSVFRINLCRVNQLRTQLREKWFRISYARWHLRSTPQRNNGNLSHEPNPLFSTIRLRTRLIKSTSTSPMQILKFISLPNRCTKMLSQRSNRSSRL